MFDDFNDNDHIDPYPHNGDLEEKAIFSLENLRKRFYEERKTFVASRPGGDLHHALLTAYGPNTAEQYANQVLIQFQHFIKQAYLTEEGETTNPAIPVDKMINHELRRIRSAVIIHVSHFFHQFESMMPENIGDWNTATVMYNLMPYLNRYSHGLYDDINVVIPNKKLKPPSTAEVASKLHELTNNLCYPDQRYMKYVSENRMYIINAARDELNRFILKDLPFNNDRLVAGTALMADEVMGTVPDVPPMVH